MSQSQHSLLNDIKPYFMRSFLVALVFLAGSTGSIGQSLTAKEKKEIFENSKKVFAEHYYFKAKVEPVINYLDKQWSLGAYSQLNTVGPLTEALSRDLKHLTNDGHLNYFHREKEIVASEQNQNQPQIPFGLLHDKFLNNGLSSVQVLPGDIGYMRIQAFGDMEGTLAGAFSFIANTNALIIDLRGNGGGMLSNYLSSFLLPEKPVHLITIQWNNRTDSIYTIEKLKGPRYLDKPVYILLDKGTFSSAEEFAYDMQALKRATLVGEKTGGGANPGGTIPVLSLADGSRVDLFVPMGKVTQPITGTNWEAKGVQPEVPVSAEIALTKAHQLALEYLESKENNSFIREQYKKIRAEKVGK